MVKQIKDEATAGTQKNIDIAVSRRPLANLNDWTLAYIEITNSTKNKKKNVNKPNILICTNWSSPIKS